MKLVVAGSRYGRPEGELEAAIIASGFEATVGPITEIVHGGALGVDAMADALARRADLPVTIFPAAWAHAGRAAGPIRNRHMADYGDALVALDGGDGTASMIRAMRKLGKPVYVHPLPGRP